MSNFNFYNANKVYGELYLQFPRVLLYSDKYYNLSDSAKIAYMTFRDRLQYSLKNNWIDEHNNVYFIFVNKELCEVLKKSEPTVIKIKKELEEAGLLLQKQMGFDPIAGKNKPNHLYLADLEVNATDIYQLQKMDETLATSGTKDSLVRPTSTETPLTKGTKEPLVRPKVSESLDTNGTKDSLVDLYSINASKDYKEFKDLGENIIFQNVFNSQNKNTETEEEQIEFFIESNSLIEFYGEELVREFKKYTFKDFNTFCLFTEKLHFAKISVEKETGKALTPFEWDKYSEYVRGELLRTFKKCIQVQRFGKAESISNYLFISFKNVFLDYAGTKE